MIRIAKADKGSMEHTVERGAEIIGGAGKIVGGIFVRNWSLVVQGAVDVLTPEGIFVITIISLFFLILPLLIIFAIPQMLFSWGTVDDAELIARHEHGEELVVCYAEEIEELPSGADPDVNWLISIESVRVKQDIGDISESDVKKSVKNSYTIDEETGEVINKSPDEIMDELEFTDEEKNWAELMYNTLTDQYLDPDSEYADVGGLSDYEGVILGEGTETEVVYYNQLDSRWANELYGKSGTIGEAGCGPTALAMAVSTLKNVSVTPPEVCEWSVDNGHRCEGSGSYHSLIPKGAEHYGLKVEKLGSSSKRELIEHLSDGKLIIVIMSKGHFTSNGHFILLRGITEDGKVLVADPASYRRSETEWDISIILNEARSDASAGGPFWSLSK